MLDRSVVVAPSRVLMGISSYNKSVGAQARAPQSSDATGGGFAAALRDVSGEVAMQKASSGEPTAKPSTPQGERFDTVV